MTTGRTLIAATLVAELLICCHPAKAQSTVDVEHYRDAAADRWESAMKEFDAQNRAEIHSKDSILFVGSSSIRLWDNIETDMAPYHPIQRGFGGSRWSDVAVYAERLIHPHRFQAIVFFVANDISGREADKTPEEVKALFQYVHHVVREHARQAAGFYIAVTPTQSRWQVWPEIRAGNELIRKHCRDTPNTYFIGTESLFLQDDGTPENDLFRDDQLHLNRDGYIRWAAAIKSHLDSVLGGAMKTTAPR